MDRQAVGAQRANELLTEANPSSPGRTPMPDDRPAQVGPSRTQVSGTRDDGE